jgi:hypothetical protein
MVMMMLIEYVTLMWKGRFSSGLKTRESNWSLPAGVLLGVIPGCLGAFTAVSLYFHRIFGFGPMLASMISTTGDEAFVMLSLIPSDTIMLNAVLISLALMAGGGVNVVLRNYPIGQENTHPVPEHHTPECVAFDRKIIIPQLRKISFPRALLLAGGVIFLFFLFTTGDFHDPWGWEKRTFIAVTIILLFISATVPDHFLNEHLWKHTILRHLPRIFLWTFMAFLAIEILLHYLHLEQWIRDNQWTVLALALAIGVIPQSGPHLIFVTFFASGSIPFSILLANSIVQDGHGAIPLLAESGRSFILMKGIKLVIGLTAGIIGILAGF